MKTGVSIREELARDADALAAELGVTRSQLYSMALGEFIERHENRELLRRLDEAYVGGLDEEEGELLARAKEHRRVRFDTED